MRRLSHWLLGSAKSIRLIVALLIILALVAPSRAADSPPPPPPFVYGPYKPCGTATIGGQVVPDGTQVSAYINGSQFGSRMTASTLQGMYSLIVPPDNPQTPEKDGGIEGDAIVFYIDGQITNETAVFSPGEGGCSPGNSLDLTINHFTIPLASGWNLISTPLKHMQSGVTDVLSSVSGHYDVVEAYDAFGSTWKIYNTSFPPSLNTLKAITEALGIWVRTTDPVTLVLTGTVPPSLSIPLATGWNLVGYPSLITRPVTVALSTIDGKYDVVEAYDAFAATWKIYNKNFPPSLNTLTDMSPGRGYWIKTTEPCTWTTP